MKTRAVRLYGEKDLRLEEFELREITDGEILIKIISDSACMSTYKTAMQGAKHLRVPDDVANNPVILGHEFCAEVAKVGKRWENDFSLGEKVIMPPVLSYLPGGVSTYSIVPEHVIENGYLMKLTSETFFSGSLIEPSSCIIRGYKASFHLDEDYNYVPGIKDGGNLAILAGCGPMGLEAIDQALHCDKKPSLLVVTDIDEKRLFRARSLFSEEDARARGIRLVFTTASTKDELLSLTSGKGFDDVFVYAPVSPVVELADSILAFDGCLNFFAGPIDKEFSAKFNFYNVHYAQHHVAGTSGSTTKDMQDIVDLIGDKRIDPGVMITHVGGINAAIDVTLNLPKIPGGKKLIYTHVDMPLSAIDDFAELGKTDARFAKLDALVKENNGLWCAAAEKYLLENF